MAIPTRPGRVPGIAILLTLTCACAAPPDTDSPADAPPAAGTAATPAAPPIAPGTPPGSLEDWVSDVALGTTALLDQLKTDVPAARQTALDLYVTRQEYIELYWGMAGQLRGEDTAALGVLVVQAEAAFHDLLIQLGATPLDAAAVTTSVHVLNDRLARVVAEAKALGVPLTPPG